MILNYLELNCYFFFEKIYGLVINIAIAKGCSVIVYKSAEKVKKSIRILISILKSYIESIIRKICNQLYFIYINNLSTEMKPMLYQSNSL